MAAKRRPLAELVDIGRLEAGQSIDDNREAFIARLIKAGWTREDASAEYDVSIETPEGEF